MADSTSTTPMSIQVRALTVVGVVGAVGGVDAWGRELRRGASVMSLS